MRYDYLLTLFTGHDGEFRPALQKPFPQENYILATDAHVLAIVDSSVCKNNYPPREKTPDALSVYRSVEQNCSEVVCIEDLFAVETHFDIKYEYTYCKECDGSGVVTCDACGHDHECDACRGAGTIETNETQMRIKTSSSKKGIRLGGILFSAGAIDKLLNAMFILGVNSCLRISNHANKGNLFKINDHCIVLIVPIMDLEGGDE